MRLKDWLWKNKFGDLNVDKLHDTIDHTGQTLNS